MTPPRLPAGAQASTQLFAILHLPAYQLRLAWQPVEVRERRELEGAFARLVRERTDVVLVTQDSLFFSALDEVVLLAARHRLPAVYANREYAEAGGLMSYGPNIAHQYRRAAVYVDKILKGARPGELAVEQPTRFELVLNLRTANALGLKISPALRLRADHIIE